MSQFRASSFDPYLIASQIALMQSAFYLSTSALTLLGCFARGADVSLDTLLAYPELSAESDIAWVVFFAYVLNAVAMAFLLVPIVGRARLVLDFTCTLYGIHFVVSILYNDWTLPWTSMWWAANLLGVLITSTLGERLCLKKELEPIAVGVGPRRASGKRKAKMGDRSASGLLAKATTALSGTGASSSKHTGDSSGVPNDAWPLQNLWRNDVGSSTLRGSNSGAAHGLVPDATSPGVGRGAADSAALLPSPSAASLTPVGHADAGLGDTSGKTS